MEDNKNSEIIINIIEVTKNEYIKNLKFNDGLLRVEEKIKRNKIEIILGLKLPGLKIHLESLVQKIKNVLKNYQRNERNLEMNKEYENIYLEKLKKYNESTSNEIINVDIFNEISKKVDASLFYDLLLEDYYTIFISNNLNRIKRKFSKEKNDDENLFNLNLLKNVLKLLVSLRRYERKEIEQNRGIECLANTIN